jgi:predicted nucleic acid-binding protein
VGIIAIPSGTVAYVDTNALIYAVEGVHPFATLLRPVWEAARAQAIRLIGSELLIIEALAGPLKQNNRPLADAYEQVFQAYDLQLLPITSTILRRGAEIRAAHGLKTPDAIHAATALQAGCSMYLTNDVGFRRVNGLAVVILNDVLNS